MKPGFVDYNGFKWPEWDLNTARLAFQQVIDAEVAIRFCQRRRAMNVVVQAGGNMGVWPKHFSRVFREVYTFEPEPTNYQALEMNCPELNIIKHNVALGDAYNLLAFHMEYPEGRQNMAAACVMPGGDISVSRIDDLKLPVCDLIQLDTEGYEPFAIMGATETIFKHRPVLMLEDKGLSEKYGWEKGWWESSLLPLKEFGYNHVASVGRDIILVSNGAQDAK